MFSLSQALEGKLAQSVLQAKQQDAVLTQHGAYVVDESSKTSIFDGVAFNESEVVIKTRKQQSSDEEKAAKQELVVPLKVEADFTSFSRELNLKNLKKDFHVLARLHKKGIDELNLLLAEEGLIRVDWFDPFAASHKIVCLKKEHNYDITERSSYRTSFQLGIAVKNLYFCMNKSLAVEDKANLFMIMAEINSLEAHKHPFTGIEQEAVYQLCYNFQPCYKPCLASFFHERVDGAPLNTSFATYVSALFGRGNIFGVEVENPESPGKVLCVFARSIVSSSIQDSYIKILKQKNPKQTNFGFVFFSFMKEWVPYHDDQTKAFKPPIKHFSEHCAPFLFGHSPNPDEFDEETLATNGYKFNVEGVTYMALVEGENSSPFSLPKGVSFFAVKDEYHKRARERSLLKEKLSLLYPLEECRSCGCLPADIKHYFGITKFPCLEKLSLMHNGFLKLMHEIKHCTDCMVGIMGKFVSSTNHEETAVVLKSAIVETLENESPFVIQAIILAFFGVINIEKICELEVFEQQEILTAMNRHFNFFYSSNREIPSFLSFEYNRMLVTEANKNLLKHVNKGGEELTRKAFIEILKRTSQEVLKKFAATSSSNHIRFEKFVLSQALDFIEFLIVIRNSFVARNFAPNSKVYQFFSLVSEQMPVKNSELMLIDKSPEGEHQYFNSSALHFDFLGTFYLAAAFRSLEPFEDAFSNSATNLGLKFVYTALMQPERNFASHYTSGEAVSDVHSVLINYFREATRAIPSPLDVWDRERCKQDKRKRIAALGNTVVANYTFCQQINQVMTQEHLLKDIRDLSSLNKKRRVLQKKPMGAYVNP